MIERAPQGRAAQLLHRNEPRGPLMRRGAGGGGVTRGHRLLTGTSCPLPAERGAAARRGGCPRGCSFCRSFQKQFIGAGCWRPLPGRQPPAPPSHPRVTHELCGTNLLGVGGWPPGKPCSPRGKYSSCLSGGGRAPCCAAALSPVLTALGRKGLVPPFDTGAESRSEGFHAAGTGWAWHFSPAEPGPPPHQPSG